MTSTLHYHHVLGPAQPTIDNAYYFTKDRRVLE